MWKSLLVAAVGLLAAGPPPGEAGKDAEALQGDWGLVSVLYDGQEIKYPEGPFLWSFAGDRLRHPLLLWNVEATFKLDPSQSPKAIDWWYRKDDWRNKQFSQLLDDTHGIYELRGDTLRICYATGQKRPSEFSAKKGEPNTIMTLKYQGRADNFGGVVPVGRGGIRPFTSPPKP